MTLEVIAFPTLPGSATFVDRMFRHAVLGHFQNAFGMIVAISPNASARETAPSEREDMYRELCS